MPNPRPALFKWRHFEPEIIVCAVRWYLRFSLSYRDVEELLMFGRVPRLSGHHRTAAPQPGRRPSCSRPGDAGRLSGTAASGRRPAASGRRPSAPAGAGHTLQPRNTALVIGLVLFASLN